MPKRIIEKVSVNIIIIKKSTDNKKQKKELLFLKIIDFKIFKQIEQSIQKNNKN